MKNEFFLSFWTFSCFFSRRGLSKVDLFSSGTKRRDLRSMDSQIVKSIESFLFWLIKVTFDVKRHSPRLWRTSRPLCPSCCFRPPPSSLLPPNPLLLGLDNTCSLVFSLRSWPRRHFDRLGTQKFFEVSGFGTRSTRPKSRILTWCHGSQCHLTRIWESRGSWKRKCLKCGHQHQFLFPEIQNKEKIVISLMKGPFYYFDVLFNVEVDHMKAPDAVVVLR